MTASPDSGNTHLTTAIGVTGITHVRFYSTVDLANALEPEKAQGRAGRIAAKLLSLDLVILDESFPCAMNPHAKEDNDPGDPNTYPQPQDYPHLARGVVNDRL